MALLLLMVRTIPLDFTPGGLGATCGALPVCFLEAVKVIVIKKGLHLFFVIFFDDCCIFSFCELRLVLWNGIYLAGVFEFDLISSDECKLTSSFSLPLSQHSTSQYVKPEAYQGMLLVKHNKVSQFMYFVWLNELPGWLWLAFI